MSTEAAEIEVGTRFGHYEIIRLIGAGGMGRVYLASDSLLKRSAAIKVFSDKYSGDSLQLGRFIREAQAASALNHPNIGTIYEINPDHEPPYLAMEFIEGETLADRIAKRRLELKEVVDITLQTAEALAEAHDAGIIHRDIKPENIIVNKRGNIKVVDFGLAKKVLATGEDPTQRQLSQAGMIIGTVRYMSPEQTRGKELDRRTDIWSLGVILYEMVTRKLPFDGDTTGDVIAAILVAAPAPLGSTASPVSADLGLVIDKALAKDKDARYPTVRHLIADLQKVRNKLSHTESGSTSDQADPLKRTTAVLDHQTVDTTGTIETDRSEAKSRPHRYKAFMASFVLMLLGLGMAALYLRSSSAAPIESLAVMPFTNETGNPESEYLSDGITESLIGRLSQIPNLSVKARSSVFRFKGKNIAIRDIGKELSVPAILTGRVTRRDNEFSLYIEMVDAATENIIWRAEYNRPQTSLATIPGEIARDVANNLRQKLSRTEEQTITRNYTDNSAAYELYLKGRFYWDKRDEESYRVADDAYKQAIALDPSYALAYAGLADLYLFRDSNLRQATMPLAKQYALKALEIDETLAEAHNTLAFINENYDYDMTAAEAGFKRAIELKPNYAVAHQFYGGFLMQTGHPEEGLAEARRAVELEPYSAVMNWYLGMLLGFARRYDEAIAQQQKALQIQPNFALSEGNLTGIYVLTGRYGDAMAFIQKGLRAEEQGDRSLLAIVYLRTGRRSDARKILSEMVDQCDKPCGNAPYGIARAYTALGESDEALRWLNVGYDRRIFNMFFLRVDPMFDTLHDDPRFQELLRRIGLST